MQQPTRRRRRMSGSRGLACLEYDSR
jgi:hypothetical protein